MLEHLRQGAGEPLVLIHGVGHHWQGWQPVVERLAGEFDVIATDTPGFGRSTPLPPGIEPTIEAYVDAFEAFFDELGVERPHVAGNSMGGGIALELARRGVIRTATAISPVGFWTPQENRYCQLILEVFHQTPGLVRPLMRSLAQTPGGRRALFAIVFARPERVPAEEAVSLLDDLWGAPAMLGTLAAFSSYVFHDADELRGVPVTVAWGSKDRLLLFGRQQPRARRVLPWARHVVLDGLGHTPMFDDPDAIAGVIRAGTRAPLAAAL
jgi:pimeloyl-ACP methyl ester carboxylesterase